jgi:hypothetical protein
MSQKLKLIFDNVEVLTNGEKYIQLPNETFRLLKRLDDEGVISLDRSMVLMDVLTFKHDEKNPFPSHEALQEGFKVGSTAIKNAIKDIVTSGLVIREKGLYGLDKRKNTYNVQPFLDLLGCFVESVRSGVDVCIKKLVKDVLGGRKAVRTEGKKEEKKEEPKLSENIMNAIGNVSDSRKKVYIKYITKHINRLDEETIIHTINKIEKFFEEGKGSFEGYVSHVFKGANNGDKAVDEAKTLEKEKKRNTGNSRKPVRVEMVPEWLDENKKEEKKVFDENEYDLDVSKEDARKIAKKYCRELCEKETGVSLDSDDFDFTFISWVSSKVENRSLQDNENYEVAIYNEYSNCEKKLRTC